MCCSDGPGGTRLTRCGVVCGLAALAALSTALLGPAWLHTEEKIPLSYISNNSPILVSVRFKLGLFRVCPKIVKPSNLTIHIPTKACTYVRYSSLEDVKPQELGFYQLEFTPTVVSKIRISAPFQVIAVVLILAGTIFALIGHCYSDHRTLVACGLFLLGGKSHFDLSGESFCSRQPEQWRNSNSTDNGYSPSQKSTHPWVGHFISQDIN